MVRKSALDVSESVSSVKHLDCDLGYMKYLEFLDNLFYS